MQWKSMKDDELLLQGGKVIERERAQTILLIEFLQEVERRKLHLKRGYPSLFELLTKHFKYCAGSAQIRINSMRLINDVPEVKEKIASGSISLTAAAQVQTFLRQERKLEHVYSREQKIDLVAMCEGKSTREVERELAELNPEFGNRDSIRAVGAERSRVTMTFSNRLIEKLDRLKAHFAHSNPSMSYEQMFERLADKELVEIERTPRKRRSVHARKTQFGSRVSKTDSNTATEAMLRAADESSTLSHSNKIGSSQCDRSVIRSEKTRESSTDSSEEWGLNFQLHAHEVDSQVECKAQKRSRHIPSAIRREVYRREGDRGCEYVDKQTGKRCGSTYFLQLDHRKPFSFGGEHAAENLRLLCAAHNRHEYGEALRSRDRSFMGQSPTR